VVDASCNEEHELLRTAVSSLDWDAVHLVQSDRASHPHQKNLGLERALRDSDVSLVQFLDDDVAFQPTYLRDCAAVFEREQDLVGVCAATTAGADPTQGRANRVFSRIFALSPGPPGSVTRVGRNAGVKFDPEHRTPVRSSWLLGCAMYRRAAVVHQHFWAVQSGYVLFEDVDFSVRARASGGLAFLPWVRLDHQELSRSSPDSVRVGYQLVVNRRRIVGLVAHGSASLFWWSVTGLALRALLGACLGHREARLRLRGIVMGCGHLMRSNWRSDSH
jgi:GT2 family glycosyltransferase